ncbi:MAG: hypothetical protein A4E60_03259 [Syntrophorhabdus sp. PtaB.Bin047]|jgi:hypothetical protein|nr:MAG: hypothetical protein A4E60_03259 [Syntrophorhabdus sp. PtaB.Bin047]
MGQRGSDHNVEEGKPAAVLKPIEKDDRGFGHIGFGAWKDREDMKDPGGWVNERRDERKGSAGTD